MPKRNTHFPGLYLRHQVWWFKFRAGGKRHYINLETTDASVAVTRATEIRANPQLTAAGPSLMAEVDQFIAYQQRMNKYTPQSARSKRAMLKLFAEYLPEGVTMAKATTRQVQAWHDSLIGRIKPSTVCSYMMCLRAFFRWGAEIERKIRRSPMPGVKIIAGTGRARSDFCPFDLRDALIRHAPTDELRLILLLGFHAGLRFQEIVEAVPRWMDLPRRQVQLRQTPTIKFKDREERTIPMTLELHAFLQSHGLPEPYLIAPAVKKGKWVYRYDFRKAFTLYMSSHGFCCGRLMAVGPESHCLQCHRHVASCRWVTPHIMRHTFASLLVSVGESIYKVAVWMGDEVQTVQKHYGHLAPDHGGIERAFSRHHEFTSSPDGTSGKSPAESRSQA